METNACPICHNDVRVQWARYRVGLHQVGFHVTCAVCGFTSDERPTRAAAIELWNGIPNKVYDFQRKGTEFTVIPVADNSTHGRGNGR